MFPKMGYCVSVEGNVVHIYKVSDGSEKSCHYLLDRPLKREFD